MERDYQVAGKTVRLHFDDSPAAGLLAHELRHYPSAAGDPDVTIVMGRPELDGVSRNPASHVEGEHGFIAREGGFSVSWERRPEPVVRFGFDGRRRSLRGKLLGMQYTHPWQKVGQIFHEAVLAPTLALFFPGDLSLVHASALQASDGRGVMVMGTGGVGKTSAELELVLRHGYRFLADDIAFLGQDGTLHPHLAFPKIYAYNVLGDADLRRRVMAGRSAGDRAWWRAQTRIRPPSRIRRRADPAELFEGALGRACPLGTAVLLFRSSSVRRMEARPLDPDTAARMSMEVLATEIPILQRHLRWHAFNRLPDGEPEWSHPGLLDRWRDAQARTLTGVATRLVLVPDGFTGPDVQAALPAVLEELAGS